MYSKIALASSTLVFQRLRLSGSICIEDQNDSIIALSRPSPTVPNDGRRPVEQPDSVNVRQRLYQPQRQGPQLLTPADHLQSPGSTARRIQTRIRTEQKTAQWRKPLAVCCRLGLAADPRVHTLAESLLAWQWPDGGWNCDTAAASRRSSFHETLAPLWGLHEYAAATAASAAADAAARAAELLLEHRLFRRLGTGEVINRAWLRPRYPPYWHYDILQGLLVLSRLGRISDPRAADALNEIERQCHRDGRRDVGAQWWNPPGSRVTPEVVDWGSGGPNEMVTLNALRVLHAAGRL